MRTRKSKWMKGETISVSIGQGAFTATPLQLAMATAITANHGSHVVPHVLRATHGAKPFTVRNAPDGKINFNGTDEDWVKMREAMIDVIQSGTGRGIRTPLYQIAGKTGTAQVKSIAQGKRYNELRLVNANLTTVFFLLALLRLINQKSLLQLFGKMAVMVVQQPNLLNPCLITGY